MIYCRGFPGGSVREAPEQTGRPVLIAVAAVCVGALTKVLLDRSITASPPFAGFIIPAVVAAWYGSYRSGLLSVVLSAITGWLLFVPPRYELLKGSIDGLTRLVLFVLITSAIGVMVSRMRDSQRTAEKVARSFRSTFENAAVGIAHVALDGRILQVNDRFCDIAGHRREELLGLTFMEITHPEDVEADWHQTRELLAERIQRYGMEKRYRRKDGTYIWIHLTVSLQRDGAGNPEHFIAVIEDISARKLALEALEQSERRLSLALSAGGLGVWDWDVKADRVTWGGGLAQLTGLSAQSVPATLDQFLDVVHPADRESVHEAVKNALAHDQPYDIEFRTLTSDGNVHWTLRKGTVLRDETGAPVRMIGVGADITERKRAERRLEERELFYRTLGHAVPDFIWVTDKLGRAVYLNQRWQQYTGKNLAELNDKGWAHFHHPDDQPLAERFAGASPEVMSLKAEFRLRRSDGVCRWFMGRAVPLRDENGAVSQWVATVTDINDLKEAEAKLRRYNEQLEQFAFAAAHDLQEPIRNVSLYSEFLGRKLDPVLDSETREFFSLIQTGAQRMTRLVKDLLLYTTAVDEDVPAVLVDSRELAEQAIAALATTIAETEAEVMLRHLPKVHAFAPHLVQVFQNLIGNSLKYRAPNRRPLVKIGAELVGHEWVFSVRDNGIGINPAYHERIFGVFKRLHTQSIEGTGIGLAIVKRIVEHYGGRIWVESAEGQGAAFRFTLPMRHRSSTVQTAGS